MTHLLQSLLTASLMMTLACIAVAFCLGRFKHITPAVRQGMLACVLLQGLMLYRVPVELPWLDESPTFQLSSDGPGEIESSLSSQPSELTVLLASSTTKPQEQDEPFGASPAATSKTSPFGSRTLIAGLFMAWLLGMLVSLLRGVLGYVAVCRQVGKLPIAPETTSGLWRRLCRRQGIKAPPMLLSDQDGPMLVRRPRDYALVVPNGYWHSLSDDQQRGVLLHELAHLRRRDVWRQLGVRLAAIPHWWNPASWWSVRRYEESVEWACDATLTRNDPAAARGLAGSLVQLAELIDDGPGSPAGVRPVLGVQSMAAPPLTQRVTRLLEGPSNGNSAMKRSLLALLIISLVTFSTLQFRLVAAAPDDGTTNAASETATSEPSAASSLQVLQHEMAEQLKTLSDQLNTQDQTTEKLKSLLQTDAGQIAFAGLVNDLQTRYRIEARGEAIPRFVEKHFTQDDRGNLTVRPESEVIAVSWLQQAGDLDETLISMSTRMKRLADRLDDSTEADKMAKRLLNDPDAAYTIILEEFDGRSNPIDLYIGKAMESLLVKRGDRWIVIPTVSDDARRQINRFDLAAKVFQTLRTELPAYAMEFASPDKQHADLVKALKEPAMAAVVSLHLTDGKAQSPAATADRLFEQLEQITKDTSQGLVITKDEAWETLTKLMDTAKRVEKRRHAVQARLIVLASELDSTDPMTSRFSDALKSGLVAYQLAADIPYADLDLGKQVDNLLSQAMEPTSDGGLRIRPDASEEVQRRAEEILAGCRTVRRYLRRVDQFRTKMLDEQMARKLEGAGTRVLLSEIRRQAEQSANPSLDSLTSQLFNEDSQSGLLTVRSDRTTLVDELSRRASEVESELGKDDF